MDTYKRLKRKHRGYGDTFFIDKADLTKVLLGQATFQELLESSAARTSGEASNLMALGSVIEMPNAKFEILPLKK